MAPKDFEHLAAHSGTRHDPVDEVRTIETADEHSRIVETKLLDDVLPHAIGRRRRVGVEARIREAAAERGELTIFRTEVVTPLADAMRLVDREALDAEARDELQEARGQ